MIEGGFGKGARPERTTEDVRERAKTHLARNT